jgi:uncharacterized protein (DUF58 family)
MTAADDFQGVRAYVPGDPLRRINWRVFARSDEAVVNDFDGGHGGDALWLDWETLSWRHGNPTGAVDALGTGGRA